MDLFKKFPRTQIAEMREVTLNDRVEFQNRNFISVDEKTRISISEVDIKNGSPKIGDMIARNPTNHEDQWLVAKQYFNENFLQSSGNLNFGQAIEALKQGKKVCREGWNGKNMYLYYVPANSYPALTENAKKEFGESVPYRAYLALKTSQNDIATWSPSTSDALAEDWIIIE